MIPVLELIELKEHPVIKSKANRKKNSRKRKENISHDIFKPRIRINSGGSARFFVGPEESHYLQSLKTVTDMR